VALAGGAKARRQVQDRPLGEVAGQPVQHRVTGAAAGGRLRSGIELL
jgi:hypothetical protein